MAMEFFQVNLPKTFLPFIDQMEGQSVDAKVKLFLAIRMYAEKQVTLARAAELAEMPLANFIDLLKSNNLSWMEYTKEQLQDDQRVIGELLLSEEENNE